MKPRAGIVIRRPESPWRPAWVELIPCQTFSEANRIAGEARRLAGRSSVNGRDVAVVLNWTHARQLAEEERARHNQQAGNDAT